jgi:hypothetical protein
MMQNPQCLLTKTLTHPLSKVWVCSSEKLRSWKESITRLGYSIRFTVSRCRHCLFVMVRRPKKYVYWTLCASGTERCLFRNNRWRGDFDQWINNEWTDRRDMYWRVVSDDGYISSWRRARHIRKALSRGMQHACRHSPTRVFII